MNAVILSFTLKGQDFNKIKPVIERISKENPNCILIHGFMPRKEVVKRGFSTDVLDVLEKNFPIQLNMYNNGVLRDEMAEVGQMLLAEVHVIGCVEAGVQEEVELYDGYDLTIHYHFI